MTVKAQQDESSSLASHSLLIEEAKFYSRSFLKLLYSHTRREGNKLAHSLARHTINVTHYAVWTESVPPQLNTVFQADLATIS